MTDRSQFPTTIRARVHDGAIDRVTRFFANSLADSFVEILQNARHSGATRLDVATEAKPSALSAVPMSMWMTMRPKANASATK